MQNSIQFKFVKQLCEDRTRTEIRSNDFNWYRIRDLPGFPKNEKIKILQICLISNSFILIKGDDDVLIALELDISNDLYVKSWELVDAIFLPSLDDDSALEYFTECAIDIMFGDE